MVWRLRVVWVLIKWYSYGRFTGVNHVDFCRIKTVKYSRCLKCGVILREEPAEVSLLVYKIFRGHVETSVHCDTCAIEHLVSSGFSLREALMIVYNPERTAKEELCSTNG
jgi:hypothetical protein